AAMCTWPCSSAACANRPEVRERGGSALAPVLPYGCRRVGARPLTPALSPNDEAVRGEGVNAHGAISRTAAWTSGEAAGLIPSPLALPGERVGVRGRLLAFRAYCLFPFSALGRGGGMRRGGSASAAWHLLVSVALNAGKSLAFTSSHFARTACHCSFARTVAAVWAAVGAVSADCSECNAASAASPTPLSVVATW